MTHYTSIAGTARVQGSVKFAGLVPKPNPINMAADPSCANLHSSRAFTQDIVANAEGGLQNVVAVIEQKGCMYEPHVIALRANQPLEVRPMYIGEIH
jgi:hypothetical protein